MQYQYKLEDFKRNTNVSSKLGCINQNDNIKINRLIPENNENTKENSNSNMVGYIRLREMELMRNMYAEINSALYPFVVEVLNEYEYIGSPIYSVSGIDRETLSQMVDMVIDRAEQQLDQVGEAKSARTGNYLREWDRWGLLRAAVESMLLNDIFAIRRPRYFGAYAPTILR